MMTKVGSKVIKSAPAIFEDGKIVMGYLLTLDFAAYHEGKLSSL